ncbi:hypothetical protein EJB05_29951, partial [Eragrostis curvula]
MLEKTEGKVIPLHLPFHLWTDQQKLLTTPFDAKNLQLLQVDCAVALATNSLFVPCSDRERGRVSKAARWLLLGIGLSGQLSAASSVSDHQRRRAKREERSESSAVPVSPEEAVSPPLPFPEKIVVGPRRCLGSWHVNYSIRLISDGGETSGAADATQRMLHRSCGIPENGNHGRG